MIPINVDRNIGPAAYAGKEGLLVTSMFYTFQGEGPYAGRPAFFLRLAGCNLGAKKECPWCDTRFNFDEGVHWAHSYVWNEYTTTGKFCGLVVVTGGEPLLQWRSLARLIECKNREEHNVPLWQFETNGILLDERILDEAMDFGNVHFVVSPKIIGGRYRDIPPEWHAYEKLISLKYIVSADESDPYHAVPLISSFVVYLSGMTEYNGEATTLPGRPVSMRRMDDGARWATLRNWEYAAKCALDLGYRVSFQTHLLAGVE
jgi:7-carboxy-7-deazaguanine synthase